MRNFNRTHTAPVAVRRSRRNHSVITLTSFQPGKCVPVVAMPMLREDALSASIAIRVEMLETKELLMNPVNLRATAYLVPLLALERFEGSRDQFDRSYMGEPKVEGGAVVPFIETAAMGTHGSNAVYKALGLHGKSTDLVNTSYLEAYNAVVNFRRKNRSKELSMRTRLQADLAEAFWPHTRFQHVVPDFDQAVIDGEVALNLVDLSLTGSAPVTGAGAVAASGDLRLQTAAGTSASTLRAKTSGSTGGGPFDVEFTSNSGNPTNWPTGGVARYKDGLTVNPGTLAVDLSSVVAELGGAGVSLSLSNLELARKTQAWAKIRERYEGIDDEYITDMLMNGITIPDQALKQPILLADVTTRFAQAKRYATDAENLAESAVSGGAALNLSIRVPKLNTGGVVMVMLEAVPEQLFERQRDPWFFAGNTRDGDDLVDLPAYLRDDLDPEKVDVVKNAEIDTDHATPNGTFGYAPMNWKWNAFGPRVGGKFYRPSTNTTVDDARQRIWAAEKVNPALSADFYLVSDMHLKPFLDDSGLVDPFEATAIGNAVIEGNTVFGGLLLEATNNYDKVMDKAPTDRIVKE